MQHVTSSPVFVLGLLPLERRVLARVLDVDREVRATFMTMSEHDKLYTLVDTKVFSNWAPLLEAKRILRSTCETLVDLVQPSTLDFKERFHFTVSNEGSDTDPSQGSPPISSELREKV